MVLVLLADGFEEIEALTPVDVLRRSGVETKTVGVSSRVAIGAHGIPVVCDLTSDEVVTSDIEMVILPGGMPGATNLDASPFVDKLIREVAERGARLAAICAAPLCLGRRGLLEGKRATCYPGFESELRGAKASTTDVVTDGNITTAKGMGAALNFALELTKLLVSEKKASEIEASLQRSINHFSVNNDTDELSKANEYIKNEQFISAVNLTLSEGRVSTSILQRNLSIGYGKAAVFIDIMEDLGIVSESNGQNPRKVLITPNEWQSMLEKAWFN